MKGVFKNQHTLTMRLNLSTVPILPEGLELPAPPYPYGFSDLNNCCYSLSSFFAFFSVLFLKKTENQVFAHFDRRTRVFAHFSGKESEKQFFAHF